MLIAFCSLRRFAESGGGDDDDDDDYDDDDDDDDDDEAGVVQGTCVGLSFRLCEVT